MAKIIPLYTSGEKNGLSDEPVVKCAFEDNEINITYIFPGFTMTDATRNIKEEWWPFKEVKISGTGFCSVDTEPLLPSLGRFVQIPPEHRVANVVSVRYDPVEINQVLITWAEQTVSDKGRVGFSEETYAKNEFLPKENVVVHRDPYYMDGYKVILVQVRPLQFNPQTRLLRGYGKIIVTITLERSEMDEKEKLNERALTDPTNNPEGFGNLLLNPKRRFFERESFTPLSFDSVAANPETPEFLIIYGENLKRPAERLRDWKIMRGLKTGIKSIDEILGSGDNDTVEVKREKIKERIRRMRGKLYSTLRYVLLFGDVDKIPVSQAKGADGETTDHYFSTPKNADGGECLLPWVSGGRIPVEESGADCVIDRIIRYEKTPPVDPEYYKRMTFAAYFLDCESAEDRYSRYRDGRAEQNFMKTMEDIRGHKTFQDFAVNRVYFSKTPKEKEYIYRDGTPVPQEVKNDVILSENEATTELIRYINEGQLIVCHRGHGLWDGWEEPSFKIPDLTSISNDWPCVLFNINCHTGDFDETAKCFAEEILANDDVNIPSLIAATFSSKRWHNDSLTKALFDAIWPGIIPVFPTTNTSYPVRYRRIGDILNYAKAYLLVKHDVNDETKGQFELYHIFGDPTLEIWVNQPPALGLDARIMMDVLSIELNTCPKGSVITIWNGNELLKRKEPSSINLTIALRDLRKNPPYSICLSAPGYRFAEKTVGV